MLRKILKWINHIPEDVATVTGEVCSGDDSKVNTLYVVLLIAVNVLVVLIVVDTFTNYKVNAELYQIMAVGIIAPTLGVVVEKYRR
jgi:hypothetical protein